MSDTQTAPPTTRETFDADRLGTVTLETGTTILVRRATLRELVLRAALPLDFIAAWQRLQNDRPDEPPAEALERLRAGMIGVAVFAAIEPRVSAAREPAPSTAIWSELLTFDELTEIFATVTQRRPMGAAAAESFRDGAAAAAGAAIPDGSGVRAETEQLGAGGPTDLQHP